MGLKDIKPVVPAKEMAAEKSMTTPKTKKARKF